MTSKDIGSRRRSRFVTFPATLCLLLAAGRQIAGAADDRPADRSIDLMPSGLVVVAPSAADPRHVLVVEKASQILHVYEFSGGHGTLLRTLPCTTGRTRGDKKREGDLRTPEGVYWFTHRIPGSRLPPLYGAGALVMDYPNRFDQLDGKTGSGIWMHGVETNDRVHVENDTRGCVALRNDDFDELRHIVHLNDTPILVVERLEFRPANELAEEAASISAFVERWRSSWESRDMDGFLSLHGPEFRTDDLDRRSWERHKRDLARLESNRLITIDGITALREKDRVWITFRQEYSSPNHHDVGTKMLFVKKDRDSWRIVGERWRSLDEPLRSRVPTIDRIAVTVTTATAQVASSPAISEPEPSTPETSSRMSATDAALPAAVVAGAQPAAFDAALISTHDDATDPPTSETPATEDALSETAAVPAPGPVARPAPPGAELAKPRVARGAFRLIAPYAGRTDDVVVVVAQLLNTTPTITRTGTLVVSSKTAAGAREISRDRFTLRQGRELLASIPSSDLPATLTVLALDEAGRVILDQDIRVTGGQAP